MMARMDPFWNASASSRAPALALLLPLLVVGCGPSEEEPPPVISQIAPVSPTGSLSGFVYDALSGAPLEGVEVVVRAAKKAHETRTDADGAYVLEGVPASDEIAVRYRVDGYFDAWDTVRIPSSAGNLAQDNGVGFSGPIGLLPTPDANAFVPEVIVRADGVAVSATVTAHLEVAWLDDGDARGSLFADVHTQGPGRFLLSGLPDFQRLAAVAPDATLRVVVLPTDGSYAPSVRSLSVESALSSGVVLVELPLPGDDGEGELVVVSSNVRDLVDPDTRFPTVLSPGTPVTVDLSAPVDADSFFATAVNDRGQALTTTSSVAGTNISLDIAGVGDGAQVFVYFEALPAGATAAQGAVRALTASGFFLTPAADGLAISLYDDARKNNALRAIADPSVLSCPADAGAAVWLELSEHVGARDENGDPVPVGQLLPIRVTSTTAPANHPLNPANGGLVAHVADPSAGTPASGFSRWVRFDWTPVDTDQPSAAHTTYQFKLVFNDASLGATGQDTVVRFPSGAPVETLQQANVQIAVRPPSEADANGCAP